MAEETLQAQQSNHSNNTVERTKVPQVDSNKTDIKGAYVETHLAEPRPFIFLYEIRVRNFEGFWFGARRAADVKITQICFKSAKYLSTVYKRYTHFQMLYLSVYRDG